MPAGGSLHPASHNTVEEKMHYVHQDRRNIFRFAVKLMNHVSAEILARNSYVPEDISLYIPHQTTLRVIQSAVECLKLRPEQ